MEEQKGEPDAPAEEEKKGEPDVLCSIAEEENEVEASENPVANAAASPEEEKKIEPEQPP